MVRSLTHWTKTLSFPARISPNKQSKENVMHVQPSSPTVTPTPSNNSLSPPCLKNNEINNMMNNNSSLTEVNKVSKSYMNRCTIQEYCHYYKESSKPWKIKL